VKIRQRSPVRYPPKDLVVKLQRITIEPTQIQANDITLTTEQQHYLSRVIRLKNGDRFNAIDGTGELYLCQLGTGTAEIINVTIADRQLDRSIVLICALPKGNNFDDIVRACTELGVTSIIPALSDRTLLQPSPQKLQRWRKIAQEAAEQSERTLSPRIAEPQPLQTIFGQLPNPSQKYLCEARGEYPHLLNCLQSTQLDDTPIVVAIGPEGGWTDLEIKLAIENNFQLVSLGRHILRTITAPIVALSIVSAIIHRIDLANDR
jgi:16S rRNA (uracil1498-N3)-methyltransferase